MVLNSLSHEKQQVALYQWLNGRSSEVLAEAMGNWDPTLLISDGHYPHKTIMGKEHATDMPRRHQI